LFFSKFHNNAKSCTKKKKVVAHTTIVNKSPIPYRKWNLSKMCTLQGKSLNHKWWSECWWVVLHSIVTIQCCKILLFGWKVW
jgi:hypothetical protein